MVRFQKQKSLSEFEFQIPIDYRNSFLQNFESKKDFVSPSLENPRDEHANLR